VVSRASFLMSEPVCQTQFFTSGDASSLSAYVILYYDYFLTLSMEVSRYWRAGSHTWASTIFLVLRYVAVLGHLPFLYRTFGNVCNREHLVHVVATYHYTIVLLLAVLTSILLVMRVYALYFRNRWILCILALEYVAGVILACWALTGLWPGAAAAHSTEHNALLKAAAFSGLLIFDLTIFILTVARSIKLWSRSRKEPFIHRVLVDGLIYYGVIWNLNLLNVVDLAINPRTELSTPEFTYILSVVMISRLMINLRDPELHKPDDHDGAFTTAAAGYISTVVIDDDSS